VEIAGMACTQCHKPHTWIVSPDKSRVLCSDCHEYRPQFQ
jgi:hypothetical protein